MSPIGSIPSMRRSQTDGLDNQFHPSYTRMIPAHYVVEIALVGCPDPDPVYTRFFTPQRNSQPTTLDDVGEKYVGAMAREVEKWLRHIDASEPIGVAFSGGIDSGAVFLVVHHVMLRLGLSPARLKAFVLNLDNGPDTSQARAFLSQLGLSVFLEEIDSSPDRLDLAETLRVLEDYKPLDVECAAMGLELCRGIRSRYPAWRHLADGDGGDENLKDYPIEENHELTIRSVIDNCMLYQEGWGVGRIKHSLTYSGGLSRSYVRTYAPARKFGFNGFSPYTQPAVVEIAEGIPFAALTGYDVPTLYSLKGEIVVARRQGGDRASTCRSSRSAAFNTVPSRPNRCVSGSTAASTTTGAPSTDSTPDARDVGIPSEPSGARPFRRRSPTAAAERTTRGTRRAF